VSKQFTVENVKCETYRSKPCVNMTDDMVRAQFDCTVNVWREIMKLLSDKNATPFLSTERVELIEEES